MFCPKCGNQIGSNDSFCIRCGSRVNNVQRVVLDDSNVFIPPNSAAVTSYYLAIFGLAFFPLSIAGLIYGIKGLSYAHENPQARGVFHALFGLILSLLTLAAVAFVIVTIINS